MRPRLETMANVAILVVCCVAVLQVTLRIRADNRRLPAIQEIKRGDRVVIRDIDWKKAERTLIIAIRTNCQYCTASLPFYRSLRSRRDAQQLGLRMVIVSSERPEVISAHLARHSVEADQVVQASFRELRVRAVPALVLVAPSGHVQESWTGQLDEDGQRQVADTLFGRKR